MLQHRRRSQLYYQAVLAIFLSGLLAFEQALAMIDRSGEPIERVGVPVSTFQLLRGEVRSPA
ncbi:imine reductase family protein [Nocardia sp. NBC_01730]|uniref:imine reductase family protein n=1 Tax=Nocardia sp. NBC_01730 TaxID=2975998 RepID=UPI002E165BBE